MDCVARAADLQDEDCKGRAGRGDMLKLILVKWRESNSKEGNHENGCSRPYIFYAKSANVNSILIVLLVILLLDSIIDNTLIVLFSSSVWAAIAQSA
jgi:hypothetical protein